jgi:hypothetical protein
MSPALDIRVHHAEAHSFHLQSISFLEGRLAMRIRLALAWLIVAMMGARTAAHAQVTNTFPATGNVGIGTTSPSVTLEVNGTTQFDGAVNASGHDAFISTYSSVDGSTPFKHINGANYAQLGQMGSNGFGIGNWANSAVLEGTNHLTLDSYSGNTYFQTGRNTVMTLLEGGNVGIGTTAPSVPLEVNGSIKLTANSGAFITFQDGTNQATAWNGVLSGGDYAESVDVQGDRNSYEPGDVLVINPKVEGGFIRSSKAYSTAVMGSIPQSLARADAGRGRTCPI